MRFGLRFQIVCALLALLILAFGPLLVALTSLTKVTLADIRESAARSLGRAVAAHVGEASPTRSRDELHALLSAQLGVGGVAAVGVYDRSGAPVVRVGEPGAVEHLSPTTTAKEQIRTVRGFESPAIEVVVPGSDVIVATLVRTSDDAGKVAPLLRLFALYTGVGALALLVFTYIALGRLIVAPIDALSSAARRVAGGARNLDVPRKGPAELLDLAKSLAEMTAKLRADEERLRAHIEELERRTQELRQARDQLVRSERLASVGRLAAGLAHEIGNPIAAIIGMHDILLEGGMTPEEQRDFLVRARAEAERIHLILRDLLDFARPAGSADGIGEPAELTEAVADVLALVRPQKAFRNRTLTLDLPEGPVLVPLARDRLVQVVLNLLLNAADATSDDGHIRVTVSADEKAVRLAVEDDGPGVSPEIRSRLFEPFVTTKEVGKGTGLGLAVCQGLVESAGGTIRLDESYTDGARFIVELPRFDGDRATPVPSSRSAFTASR